MNKFKHSETPDIDKLWIIAVVSNPERYKSRYELFHRFKKSVEVSGANLLIVEMAFGSRPFELTEPNNPHHVQLRSNAEVWHKENMINIGISRLPQDWKYVAWIDADIEFMRQDWPDEIIHQLQHFHVIQLFQNAIDLGPEGQAIKTMDGFVYSWLTGQDPAFSKKGGSGPYWHPGYAWAARREAIDALGGLIDFAILGAADHHMAWAFLGKVIENTPKEVTPAYRKHLEIWQDRATVHIRQNVGYMPGTIFHHWHGSKVNRFYTSRWKILTKHGFNPELDLKRDWQGVWHLSDVGLRMRNDLRAYFRSRNEDGVDM
jgi:hypothetical protein